MVSISGNHGSQLYSIVPEAISFNSLSERLENETNGVHEPYQTGRCCFVFMTLYDHKFTANWSS